MHEARIRPVAMAIIAIGAGVATGAALLLPIRAFDDVLAVLIGQPGHANTTLGQRLVAVAGVWLGAIGLGCIVRATTKRTLARPIHLGALAVAVFALAMLNAAELALRLGALPAIRLSRSLETVMPLLVGALFGGFLATNTTRRAEGIGLWAPAAAGAAYGCFSGLWHCCAPWWRDADWQTPLWFGALALSLGAVGRAAASLPIVRGELLGAAVFGSIYPWHTSLFFVQNLVGGVFATALVRVTGSGWAPAVFLGVAYVTHTTLPFLGAVGVVVAFGLLARCAALARAWWPSGAPERSTSE